MANNGKGYRMNLSGEMVRRNCDGVGQAAYDKAISEGKTKDEAKDAYRIASDAEYSYYCNV